MFRIEVAIFATLLNLTSCDSAKRDASGEGPSNPFSEYQAKSMAAEAKLMVRTLQDQADLYVTDGGFRGADSLTLEVGVLPPSAGPTPALGSCCKLPNGTCEVGDAFAKSEAWQAYTFSPSGSVRYTYETKSEGDKITIRAMGDLDCDGVFSTYESIGQLEDGALKFREITNTQPLE